MCRAVLMYDFLVACIYLRNFLDLRILCGLHFCKHHRCGNFQHPLALGILCIHLPPNPCLHDPLGFIHSGTNTLLLLIALFMLRFGFPNTLTHCLIIMALYILFPWIWKLFVPTIYGRVSRRSCNFRIRTLRRLLTD